MFFLRANVVSVEGKTILAGFSFGFFLVFIEIEHYKNIFE